MTLVIRTSPLPACGARVVSKHKYRDIICKISSEYLTKNVQGIFTPLRPSVLSPGPALPHGYSVLFSAKNNRKNHHTSVIFPYTTNIGYLVFCRCRRMLLYTLHVYWSTPTCTPPTPYFFYFTQCPQTKKVYTLHGKQVEKQTKRKVT